MSLSAVEAVQVLFRERAFSGAGVRHAATAYRLSFASSGLRRFSDGIREVRLHATAAPADELVYRWDVAQQPHGDQPLAARAGQSVTSGVISYFQMRDGSRGALGVAASAF